MTELRSDLSDPIARFVAFTRALRSAGLHSRRSKDFIEAVGALDAAEREDVYWAGRATLCNEPDDIPVYDRVFQRWFAPELIRVGHMPTTPRPQQASIQLGEDGTDTAETGEDDVVAAMASARDQLKYRDVAELDSVEREQLARLFRGLPVRVPRQQTLRRRPSHRGDIDIARSMRDQLRRAGEPGPLRYRSRRNKPRRIVFLIDVSGSMKPYADSLLRLAHRVVQEAAHITEVFTLGTRLTRVTSALQHRDAEEALAAVGSIVSDWSGGTRLGEVLRAFVDRWGQRGVARRAVVVVASDGWERGDPTLLGEQAARLHRLAHAVIWSNPHRGKPGYAPIQGGIAAVLPYLDTLVAGHSLAAFEELLETIGHS